MAKTNAVAVHDSTEFTQEPDKLAEAPTMPVTPDIDSNLEDNTPPWETPAPEKSSDIWKRSLRREFP